MTVHSKTAAALDAAKAAGRTGLVAFLPAGQGVRIDTDRKSVV
mgnify:CR=1 FL=1